MIRMTKKKAIVQLEDLKEHCNDMSKSDRMWENDVIALDTAIKELKKDTVLRESHEHDIHVLRKELKRRTVKLERIIEILNTHDKDRNEMIVNDIKSIIRRYDDMNLNVSFEERKENHIKAYMEIKDYFNTTEDKKE